MSILGAQSVSRLLECNVLNQTAFAQLIDDAVPFSIGVWIRGVRHLENQLCE